MNKNIVGFLVVVVFGVVGIVGTYFYKTNEEKKQQEMTSDASHIRGSIKIGVDNWIGYFPLCSTHMTKLMRGAGYLLECVDDSADYSKRMKGLKKGDLNFAVATIDSYLINAEKYNFPGAIISVIDESAGGDAIVAYKDKFPKLDSLKEDVKYKVAFTPASPSEHLLRSVSVHFDIPKLREGGWWRKESDGSSEALKKLLDGDVEIAVLWEPDVSKALSNSKFVKLLGTEDTKKLIVDILLVSREYSKENPEAVKALLANYFRTLKHYRNDPGKLAGDVKKSTDLSNKQIKAMLKGVRWANLYDNASIWFGLNPSAKGAGEGVIETLQTTSKILQDTEAVKNDPIPDSNPYSLQNRSFIEHLFTKGITSSMGGSSLAGAEGSGEVVKQFSKLPVSSWEQLKEVGTFRVRPITFQSGTAKLDDSGQEQLKEAAKALEHYPNFRVVVRGHTGIRGDKVANRKLSQQRADAVTNYLISNLGVDQFRPRSIGHGSDMPLARKPGESSRAYNYRLPRVELSLVSEVF